MKNWWPVLILALVLVYFWWNRTPEPVPQRPIAAPIVQAPVSRVEAKPMVPVTLKPARTVEVKPVVDDGEPKPLALHYRIENGMYIVQGDVVAGSVIQGQTPAESGLVEMDPLKLWPKTIPYHIQPEVVDPERIHQALRMFDGTAVHFVPYNGEDDAIVFEVGQKDCYSYVGKVTKKQQIWISPGCSPADIAHEIMHALGFVHEQNRTDRDDFITVLPENIEDEFRYNFEKLPKEFMSVTGKAPFDYQSLMLYPPWMFAKSGRSTMEPKNRDHLIEPLPRPSPGDIERLNRAYQ